MNTASQTRPRTVLDEPVFPIVGWAGLSGEMIRPETMRDMRAAGFTINMGGDANRDPIDLLDIAHDANLRMILAHPAMRVTNDYVLTNEHRQQIEELVKRVKDHPALYMYNLRDEPYLANLEPIHEVATLIRQHDQYHPCYVNHHPPIGGKGAATVEEFHQRAWELLTPEFLSYDHYSICIASERELSEHADTPWMLPAAHTRIKPDFYQCLDLFRRMALAKQVPFWAFTNAVRHGYYPTPSEGHMRFQLMSALAYGARGLQYFTYAYNGAMVRPDGTRTETWELARRINADIHLMAPILRRLRSIGVYHAGPLWPMSAWPPADLLEVEGDAALIGVFRGEDDGLLYLMVVSKNPTDWSLIHLKLTEPQTIFELDRAEGIWTQPYPRRPERQPLTLAPGEGRLLRLGGEGERRF